MTKTNYPCAVMFQSLNKKYYVGLVEDINIYDGSRIEMMERVIREGGWESYESDVEAWYACWELHGRLGNVGRPKRLMPVLLFGSMNDNPEDLIITLGVINISGYKDGYYPPPPLLHRCSPISCSICKLGLHFINRNIVSKIDSRLCKSSIASL